MNAYPHINATLSQMTIGPMTERQWSAKYIWEQVALDLHPKKFTFEDIEIKNVKHSFTVKRIL